MLKSEYFTNLGVELRLFLVHVDVGIVLMYQVVELVVNAYLYELAQQVLDLHPLRYAKCLIDFLPIPVTQIRRGDFQTGHPIEF